ncbi:LOW QUALITY PROTEIN: uncharacterized protein K02A2.6-like [Sardina pilchardus]|uniref:LOW QUALITY PROTEIN: uncharacterized protein K02A2.6-like n=1 Tax=Sardina pilchardus TaxID=27697 RepID=UPI002E10360A
MATYGKLGEYDPEADDWQQYEERLAFYFAANEITDAGQKRAIFLSACGGKTYATLRDLCQPGKPGDKSLTDLLKLLTDHYAPKRSIIVERFKFHSKVRDHGLSVAAFVAELRRLSEHCAFGTSLNDMLRDRLVCGINDDRIQRRLLSEPDDKLTWERALELATAMETAMKDVAQLQQKTVGQEEAVHQVQPPVSDQKMHVMCFRCGGTHAAADCRFAEAVCHNCRKKGHLARKCRSARQPKQNRFSTRGAAHMLENEDEQPEYTHMLHNLRENKVEPYREQLSVNGHDVTFEIDTGAGLTIVNERTYRQIGCGRLHPAKIKLYTYTKEKVDVLGKMHANVIYKGQTKQLPLLVVRGEGPNLLGRDWLKVVRLDWTAIFKLQEGQQQELETLLSQHQDLFKSELGTLVGATAKIYVDPEAKPRYFKARPLPYALKEKVETELTRLQKEGILEPVSFAEWAAPIVPIVKPDKSIRICGDYKVTVNPVSKLDNYPIPKTEDLLAVLGGGHKFTKLDMSQAYQQLPLEENSKTFTTINTHRGLYQYTRLPYGVSSAPGIFQRTMDNLLQGLPQVVVRVDDILVTGKDDASHLQNLGTVLSRLNAAGLRLKREKCIFMAPEVVYLGYRINHAGIQPVADKVEAIANAAAPTNQTQLKSFLGMLNYYHRFLPNVATVLEPLHELLRKGVPWKWEKRHESAFDAAKKCLQSEQLLMHFDDTKPLYLACDASPYGVGAVLSHRLQDGADRPIGYMSRSLSSAERGYSQLEKEALAIIFGLKKFHQYLYGKHCTIVTDHKPLLGLFGELKGIPQQAAARMQRWALMLAAYEYTLEYKEGSRHGNADALSRLPLPSRPKATPQEEEVVMLMEHMNGTPVQVKQIRDWTRRDRILSRIQQWMRQGSWPVTCTDPELQPYVRRQHELSMEDGCILWGSRVIIPPQGRETMIEELHEAHPGASRIKMLARSYVWWPNMDAELEAAVRKCHVCQINQASPAAAPLHPWEWPAQPWMRLHVDFCGPVSGKMFLIVIDAYSKWIEAHPMQAITSTATIEKLRSIFATHGIPAVLVSDNGPSLVSAEFKQFLTKNGIKHVNTAPYHPSSNGCAERAVRVFKEGIRKMGEGSLETKVSRLLFKYRSTPQTTTGATPAELLMNRRLRSVLDLVCPALGDKVGQKQAMQKEYHDKHARDRAFTESDQVYVRGYSGQKWIPATLIKRTGPVSWRVKTQDGKVARRHQDQIRPRYDQDRVEATFQEESVPENLAPPELSDPEPEPEPLALETGGPGPPEPSLEEEPRFPVRLRQAPTYLKDYVLPGAQ